MQLWGHAKPFLSAVLWQALHGAVVMRAAMLSAPLAEIFFTCTLLYTSFLIGNARWWRFYLGSGIHLLFSSRGMELPREWLMGDAHQACPLLSSLPTARLTLLGFHCLHYGWFLKSFLIIRCISELQQLQRVSSLMNSDLFSQITSSWLSLNLMMQSWRESLAPS